MKFVFPQNYKYSNKLFGMIDYSTAVINVLWYVIVYFFVNLIFKEIKIKLFLFILFSFPFFLLSVIGLSRENIITVIRYVVKFFRRRKIYLYK